jgi:hypothetical protein
MMRSRHPVGNPKRRYDEHSSKFLSVVKPRFIELVGESQTSEGWCLLASRQLRTIYMAPRSGLSFAPAATWNLHTTQPSTLSQLTMRLSILPVCCKQRIKHIECNKKNMLHWNAIISNQLRHVRIRVGSISTCVPNVLGSNKRESSSNNFVSKTDHIFLNIR